MKLSKYAKELGICYRTAWNMFHRNEIPGSYKLQSGTIIVPDNLIKNNQNINKNIKVCIYARVSSSQNKSNLDSQAKRLEQYCIAKGWKIEKIIKEIGSGINDNRKQLTIMLKEINNYDYIVIEHKDRLTRMGFNYFNIIFSNKIHVVNETQDKTEDLMQDLIAIITSFCARLYGQRKGKRKTEKIIKELQSND
ncbi:MAG: IS607 family transposase [Clostridia bacterium]|jgi:predicted site-specific integrase-resolvase